jgi:formate hydrogenlyase subunit 3/multisubunit Na+/H+ antiporter MnhD subunit
MIVIDSAIQTLLMLAVFCLPLVLAIGLPRKNWQPALIRLAPWSAVPALVAVAASPPGVTVSIDWLLLNAHFGLDPTASLFLFFTAALWFLAGIYAQSYLINDSRRNWFFAFFLLSMSGNLGLIVSRDVVSFYVFFALMSFASYGLVVHSGNTEAFRAGRIYIILVVVGELVLFVGFIWQTSAVGSLLIEDFSNVRPSAIIVGLILIGFGIKAGALPVHVWLPLAHPAAPTPASAVLSGAMIKAGLLGWLRFLPIGQTAIPQWGAVCIIVGLLAAYYAVAVGLTQRNPKTVLAYSSISQMGLMTVGVGLAIGWPQTIPMVIPAIGIYAIHHALAKGALFLGVGVIGAADVSPLASRLAAGGMIFASLALAGAPFTSGAVAKTALKFPLKSLQDSWISGLNLLLPLAAIGTTLLMSRLIFILTTPTPNHGRPRPGMWLSWMLTLLLTASAVWLVPAARQSVLDGLHPASLWQALWPVSAGILISAIAWLIAVRNRWSLKFVVPQGDILLAFNRLFGLIFEFSSASVQRTQLRMSVRLKKFQNQKPPAPWIGKLTVWLENRLTDWQTACLIFVLLTGCLFAWGLT